MRWSTGGSRLLSAFSCAFVLALFGVEAAFGGPEASPARAAAAHFWVAAAGVVIVASWAYALSAFRAPGFWRDPARAWYLLACLLPPALVLVDAGGDRFTTIDVEGAEQLTISLRLLHQNDLGIYAVGYVGCLNRATLLNALPTLLLGRNLWALRLGNSAIYLGSYGFFLAALAEFLRRRAAPDPLRLAAYAGTMISLGGYALEVARKFEQTSEPLAYTLLFLGTLLLYLAEPGPLRLVGVVWSFGMLPYAYTPALGTWGLGMVALVTLAVRERRRLLWVPAVYGSATLAEALVITDRDSGLVQRFIVTQPDHQWGDHLWHYASGLRIPISADFSLIPPPLSLAVLALLYLSWRRRERLFPLLCLWAAAVAFAALAFIGSNYAHSRFTMHRSLIMLGPLALGTVLWLARLQADAAARKWIGYAVNLSMAYMILTSVNLPFTVRSFFGVEVVTNQEEMLTDVIRLQRGARPPRRIILTKDMDDLNADAVDYFAPGATVFREGDPAATTIPGTYRFSYLSKNPDDHSEDELVPSHRRRPFIKVEEL